MTTAAIQRSQIFLEKREPGRWLLAVDGEQIAFSTEGGAFVAADLGYVLLAARGLHDLVFQPLAADGRYYAIRA